MKTRQSEGPHKPVRREGERRGKEAGQVSRGAPGKGLPNGGHISEP